MPTTPAWILAAALLAPAPGSAAVPRLSRATGSCAGAVHAIYEQVAGSGGQRRWEARVGVRCRRTGPARFYVTWRSRPSREEHATVVYTLHHYYVGVIVAGKPH